MRIEEELAGLLPPAPPDRQLARAAQHRADLLAAIAAEPTQRRGIPLSPTWRWPAARRWLVPAGAAAAVCAVVLAAVTVSVAELQHPGSRAHRRTSGQQTTSGVRRWQVASAGLRAVVVRMGIGSITVVGGGSGSVSIAARPRYRGTPPTISEVVRHGVLTVSALCPADQGPQSKSKFCKVPVIIRLPSGIPVQASTDLGSVSISGVTGNVAVTDRLGSIDLSGLRGSVTATDNLGDIVGHDLDSTRVRLSADLGAIRVAFSVAPVRVDATDQDGSVAIEVPAGGSYRVNATAQLGSVAVTVPRSASSAHVINASSQLGSVSVTR